MPEQLQLKHTPIVTLHKKRPQLRSTLSYLDLGKNYLSKKARAEFDSIENQLSHHAYMANPFSYLKAEMRLTSELESIVKRDFEKRYETAYNGVEDSVRNRIAAMTDITMASGVVATLRQAGSDQLNAVYLSSEALIAGGREMIGDATQMVGEAVEMIEKGIEFLSDLSLSDIVSSTLMYPQAVLNALVSEAEGAFQNIDVRGLVETTLSLLEQYGPDWIVAIASVALQVFQIGVQVVSAAAAIAATGVSAGPVGAIISAAIALGFLIYQLFWGGDDYKPPSLRNMDAGGFLEKFWSTSINESASTHYERLKNQIGDIVMTDPQTLGSGWDADLNQKFMQKFGNSREAMEKLWRGETQIPFDPRDLLSAPVIVAGAGPGDIGSRALTGAAGYSLSAMVSQPALRQLGQKPAPPARVYVLEPKLLWEAGEFFKARKAVNPAFLRQAPKIFQKAYEQYLPVEKLA